MLFSVTPINQDHALENIREALDAYLQLPTKIDQNSILVTYSGEIEVQRLSANITRLQSEIMLARATIQMQQATIETKNISIRQLEGEIFRKAEISTEKNTEDFIGGAIKVKPYDAKIADIDLPLIFRYFKKKFLRNS